MSKMWPLSSWGSWMHFCYPECCYGRMLWHCRDWQIAIVPRPLPTLDWWRSQAEYVLVVGWFVLRARTQLGMKLPYAGHRPTPCRAS